MNKLVIPIIDVKKYGGKQVAIVKGKIVAAGTDTREVLARVKLRLPRATWHDILLVSVPRGLTVVYPARKQDFVPSKVRTFSGRLLGRRKRNQRVF